MVANTYSISAQETVRWPQYLAAFIAALGAFAIGTALGWTAPAESRFNEENGFFDLTDGQFGWAASALTVGAAVSCLPIGILMKVFGRKWTMISLVAPFLIGWGLVIWAQNFVMLLIGRFMLGLAGGAFCVSAPQYSSEIAEKEIRGIVGTFFQVLINGGILFVYVVGAYASIFWTSIICGIVPIVFGILFILMPESPVFYVFKRKQTEATKSLTWLRGKKYDPLPEITELTREIEEQEDNKVSFFSVLGRKSTKRALFIGFGLMFFQQVSGINLVIFYSTQIFESAETNLDPDLQTIIVGSILLVATLLGTVLVDRVGRKILLILSSFFMMIMLAALGAYFYLLENDFENIDNLAWLPLTSLGIFLVAFSIGYGPIPWLMLSEIYSKEYNAIASPISGSFNWLLAFAVTSTFTYITDAIGTGPTFWIFAGLTLLGLVFSSFAVIETKGKTMAEIQEALAN